MYSSNSELQELQLIRESQVQRNVRLMRYIITTKIAE